MRQTNGVEVSPENDPSYLRQDHWPCLLQDAPEMIIDRTRVDPTLSIVLHLKFSDSNTWQDAWCSNWSSSQRNCAQNEHWKTRPPIVVRFDLISDAFLVVAHLVPKHLDDTRYNRQFVTDIDMHEYSNTFLNDRPTLRNSHK